jgi:hypothetical protein
MFVVLKIMVHPFDVNKNASHTPIYIGVGSVLDGRMKGDRSESNREILNSDVSEYCFSQVVFMGAKLK